jgi:hypothetical protein
MRLPTWLKLICRADGAPTRGMFVTVRLKMSRKNDFSVLAGPTDEHGAAVLTREEIDRSVEWDRNTFVMDYTGLGDSTGEIVISPLSRKELHRAMDAYKLFRSANPPYPPRYPQRLQEALQTLETIVPATLSVEVEHDGEGIQVRTLETPA